MGLIDCLQKIAASLAVSTFAPSLGLVEVFTTTATLNALMTLSQDQRYILIAASHSSAANPSTQLRRLVLFS